MKMKVKRMMTFAVVGFVVLVSIYIAGCVRFSGGTWMIKEAPLPDGWPELTPVGEVAVRQYPGYRAAVVDDTQVRGEMGTMFSALFDHIKRNDIAMTTPVAMGYTIDDAHEADMTSMAFMYRRSGWGEIGRDGSVEVRDMQPQTMASIGVRGDYNRERFQSNLTTLTTWLDARADRYRITGTPRYLGYNGPFTLPFMRYGEVQVPIEAIADIE